MKCLKEIFFVLMLISGILHSQSARVYVANIEGDIDLGLAPYVKRVVESASENNIDVIIFEINTFGGRVDAATQIKDAILNSKVPTIAFINKRAISAGALISLSCNKIAMVPGASIGAATVVDQQGQKQAEKYQSYMRSEMRATAESNGRPIKIAEAMVDERVVIPGLVDSTQLVTLTYEEAKKWGISDTTVSSLKAALNAFGYEEFTIEEQEINWAEDVVRFLNNPIISSLLIMIGLFGLFAEVKSPGWGVPGTAGLLALTLFFGTNFILELAQVWEIVLFIVGVILLVIEIFAIPGFGIFGILGITAMVSSLFLGLIGDFDTLNPDILSTAIIQLAAAIIITIASMIITFRYLPSTPMFARLILNEGLSGTSGYTTSAPDFEHLLGKNGISYTVLRPSGTVIIDDKRYDAVTAGEYLDREIKIKVVQVSGSKVVVQEIKEG